MVVGGYAVAYHGYPRATADLDVWFNPAPENVERLIHALVEFGFPNAGSKRDVLSSPGRVLRMGVPPNRIALLTQIDGLSWDECIRNAAYFEIDGERVPVIGLQDLKRNKRASGRLKDLNDLEHLPLREGKPARGSILGHIF